MKLLLIQNKIFKVKGQNVMLDFDLAVLYETETRILKQAVKRNIERFPDDFMFQLDKKEWQELITICDKFPERIRHTPVPPFAFTEQGVAMLSGVLHNEKAIEVSIHIVRAFVYLRQYALTYKDLADRLKELEGRFTDVTQAINYLLSKDKQEADFKKRKRIGYKPDE